jgi:hypothetical protein
VKIRPPLFHDYTKRLLKVKRHTDR